MRLFDTTMNLRQVLNESRLGKAVNETYLGRKVQELSGNFSDYLKAVQYAQIPTEELFVPYLNQQIQIFKEDNPELRNVLACPKRQDEHLAKRFRTRFGDFLERLYESTQNGTKMPENLRFLDQKSMKSQLRDLVLDYRQSFA